MAIPADQIKALREATGAGMMDCKRALEETNGDFEKGKESPDGWQKVDGLTTFWVDDPDKKRGKVIKFDTDVLQSQAYDWWVKFSKGAKASKVSRHESLAMRGKMMASTTIVLTEYMKAAVLALTAALISLVARAISSPVRFL